MDVTDAIEKKAQAIVADARKRASSKWGAGWVHLTSDHKRAEIALLVVGAINVCDLSDLGPEAHARLAFVWQRASSLALQEV